MAGRRETRRGLERQREKVAVCRVWRAAFAALAIDFGSAVEEEEKKEERSTSGSGGVDLRSEGS